MAKVKGPLMSMEASGAYGGSLVFGRRLGQNVVRQLVRPANPQSEGQMIARNRVRVFGAIQSFMNKTALILDGETKLDKERVAALTPAGQRWNSYIQQVGIGAGGTVYSAAESAYAALGEAEKTAWDTAAAALSPALVEVAQKTEGGADIDPKPAGEVFFIMVNALSRLGLAPVPGATPPSYA